MRILAVDFGEKRIGLATSDASGSVATPRRTVTRRDDTAAAELLKRFCEEEEVGLVVFGVPRSPEGEESDFAARVRSFAKKFAKHAALPVCFHEETLTSHEAARRLSEKGPSRARRGRRESGSADKRRGGVAELRRTSRLASTPLAARESPARSRALRGQSPGRGKRPPPGRRQELDAEAAAVLLEDFLQHRSRSGDRE